ncbi:hypothetical protein [Streptomyces lavendulae]|uniref:hypothetical protein n=1 Tax=Streptomyces lavendulae TaxID=1914 RepID=UPI0025525BFD|nr:hypothetical protein [Streptomyces lavendulae]
MIREPAEATVMEGGIIEIPMGVLVEAGLHIGEKLLAFSDGDGRITLRRATDAVEDLLRDGTL